MADFLPLQDRPDVGDEGVLLIGDKGLVLDRWTSYRWDSDFTEPADDFEFTLAADHLPKEFLDVLQPGTRCGLQINSALQCTGYIDSIEFHNSRGTGTEMHVRGRDALAPVVDGHIDPTTTFPNNSTLAQILERIFLGTYGFDSIVVDNADNRSVLQGQTRGQKTSKKGKPLKSFVTHQLKPYPSEGAFTFASRVSQRHGLWLWASADGKAIIASTPNYEQPASYTLTREVDGANNILDGGIERSGKDQPSLIIATGFGGGGDFAHTSLKAALINELTGLDQDDLPTDFVSKALLKHKDAKQLGLLYKFDKSLRFAQSMPRVAFVHDDSSHTPEQLEAFVRREMSLKQQQAVVAHYTVKGHVQNGTAWAVDTIVQVTDERCHFTGPMWVKKRTFTKSRHGGTLTQLTAILPHALTFDKL